MEIARAGDAGPLLASLVAEAAPASRLRLATEASTLARLRRLLDERSRPAGRAPARWPSGWSALDEALGGGFLRGALNEIASLRPGSGLIEALLPAFLREERAPGEAPRFLAWVAREAWPYPPALARLGFPLERWLVIRPRRLDEELWALEQLLRSGLCAAVLGRLAAPRRRGLDPDLRRLQLAAREGDCTVLLWRRPEDLQRSSPAPVRLLARALPAAAGRRRLLVEVLKTRGRHDAPPVLLEWSHDALDESPLSRACAGEPDASPLRGGAPRPHRALPA